MKPMDASHAAVLFLVLLPAALIGLPGARAQVDLPAAVYSIDGKVYDGQAKALSGADLALLNDSNAAVANTTSGSDGAYTFRMVSKGNYTILGSHACCLRASVVVAVGGLQVNVTAPKLELPLRTPVASGDPVRLSGTVRSGTAGVAGAHVFIQSTYESKATSTPCNECGVPSPTGYQSFSIDTDGTGAFDVQINRGRAHVRVTHDGYDATVGDLDMSRDRTVDVPLQPAGATVRLHGTLRDDRGATVGNGWVNAGPDYYSDCPPNADCAVRIMKPQTTGGDETWQTEPSAAAYNSTQTRGDGTWEMTIAPGRVRVSASAPDHLENSSLVDARGSDVEVALVVERIPAADVVIQGTVTDRETGKPVPNAAVNVENQKWGTWASATSDEAGRYTVKTQPGHAIVTISSYGGYACAMATATVVSSGGTGADAMMLRPCAPPKPTKEYFTVVRTISPAPGAALKIDAALASRAEPTSEFLGYAVDATSHTGVAGAVVTFANELTHDWGSATTDADGSYRIKVHAGYYTIRTWANGYFDAAENREIDDHKTERVDVELAPGAKRYGLVYGMAPDSRAGPVASGAPSSSGAAGMNASPSAAPRPTGGTEVFHGEAGGLGPYRGSAGHGAPGATLLVGLAAIGVVLCRRRA